MLKRSPRPARLARRRARLRRRGHPLPEAGLAAVLQRPRVAGLVCTLLYMLSQWREIGASFAGRQARFGTLAVASVVVVARDPRRHQLPRHPPQQAVGPDGGEAVLALGPDAQGARGAEGAGPDPRLRAERRLPALPRSAGRVYRTRRRGLGRVHRSRKSGPPSRSNTASRHSARWCSTTRGGRRRRRPTPSRI